MKKNWALLLLLAACGCTAVFTREPIGERPVNIKDEQAKLAGTWVSDDEFIDKAHAFTVRVEDSSNGVLQLAWVLPDSLQPRKANVYLRDANGWILATLRPLASGDVADTNACMWARITRRGNTLLIWMPDGDKFAKLVGDNQLPGTVTRNGDNESQTVVLGHLGSNELARLTSSTNDVLFHWAEPYILRRIGE